MVNFVIALECFGICLTVIALLLLLNGEGAKEQKLLIIIMCSSLVQNVGYLLELTAPALEAAMAAITCCRKCGLRFCVDLLLLVYLSLLLYETAEGAFEGSCGGQFLCPVHGVF